MSRIINIMSKVRQQSFRYPQLSGDLNRATDTEVRFMFAKSQGINYQHIQSFQQPPRRFGYRAAIDHVGKIADPVTERFARTVHQGNRDHLLSEQLKRSVYVVYLQTRSVTRNIRFAEDVAEQPLDSVKHTTCGINRDCIPVRRVKVRRSSIPCT